jgi:hypothetical protein
MPASTYSVRGASQSGLVVGGHEVCADNTPHRWSHSHRAREIVWQYPPSVAPAEASGLTLPCGQPVNPATINSANVRLMSPPTRLEWPTNVRPVELFRSVDQLDQSIMNDYGRLPDLPALIDLVVPPSPPLAAEVMASAEASLRQKRRS